MNRYLTPAIVSISVFMFCVSVLFIDQKDTMNSIVLYVCLGYALLCLAFLIFQIYAFIKAHVDYDEDVEMVKYKVFEAEGISIDKEEII